MKRILIPAVCAAALLTSALTLTACAAATGSPTPTPSPSPTATVTVTPSLTVTPSIIPSPTITPTATEPLSSADFLALPVAENFLFTPESDTDCLLPCWHGLVIGESNRQDIQEMFDADFGLEGRDIFEIPFPDYIASPPAGLEDAVLIWSSDPGNPPWLLQIHIFIQEETQILQALSFVWLPDGVEFAPPITPQNIIRELGTPDYAFLSVEQGQMNSGFIQMEMIYNEGVVIFHDGGILIEDSQSEEKTSDYVEICSMITLMAV